MQINYLRYLSLRPFKSWRNKFLKYLAQREGRQCGLYDEALKEIASYTGEPITVVRAKHRLVPESEENFRFFRNQQALSEAQVDKFYRECSYYIYELPLWNAECNRPKYLFLLLSNYIKRRHYRKVMDFGAGAGDFCIELAKHNLAITYCEIGEKLYQFTKWRFARRNLAVEMARGMDIVKEGDFDCIFSFDTFEHLKDLPRIIGKLVEHIKPAGSLIFSAAFSGGKLHLEENEKYNEFKMLDTLMQDFGLIFQDKFAQFYFYQKAPS